MYLQTLTVRQFRSYADLTLSVDSGVNLFLGLNGSGKTNLVEAVAVLTTGVSPRGADTEALVQWGTNGFYIGGRFAFDSPDIEPVKLDMKYQTGSTRVVRKNGSTAVRIRDLIGLVPIVTFVPEDLSLVKGEPGLRRRAINMILMQVDGAYAREQKAYNDAVKERNAALRQVADGSLAEDALAAWDRAVASAGLSICRKRAAFIEEFSLRAAGIHHRVSGLKERLELRYKPSFDAFSSDDAEERWIGIFESDRRREIALGMTMTGPHRDDLSFLLDGRPARSFASEGQKRTGAVSFKLAEIPYIQEKKSQKPLCLLDDVLSELDAERASHLLDELSRTSQCLVTMTGLESWPRDRTLPASVFRVDGARVCAEPALGSVKPEAVAF